MASRGDPDAGAASTGAPRSFADLCVHEGLGLPHNQYVAGIFRLWVPVGWTPIPADTGRVAEVSLIEQFAAVFWATAKVKAAPALWHCLTVQLSVTLRCIFRDLVSRDHRPGSTDYSRVIALLGTE